MKNGYDQFFEKARRAKQGARKAPPSFKLDPKRERQVAVTPEERLKAKLAARLREKRRQAVERKKFPLYPIFATGAMCVLCALAYVNSDTLDVWLENVEIGFFGMASAAPVDGPEAEKTSSTAPVSPAKAAESKAVADAQPPADVKKWTPEELSFLAKLDERKKELDLREAELKKLEEELQKRQVELDAKLKELEKTREDISRTLQSRVASDHEKVDKLVQVYSGMKAAQAAKVIESLNEDLAVEVLDRMKKKNAAEILDMMSAKKARRLSELLTGYRRSLATADEGESESGKGEAGASAE